jgi:hypothetical protein
MVPFSSRPIFPLYTRLRLLADVYPEFLLGDRDVGGPPSPCPCSPGSLELCVEPEDVFDQFVEFLMKRFARHLPKIL